jgi:signal transduction histidine kinase
MRPSVENKQCDYYPLTAPDTAPAKTPAVKIRDYPVEELLQLLERENAALRLAQHALEERLAARTAELASTLAAAEAASRAKSTFLCNTEHEIRTPLTGIIGVNTLLMLGASEPKLLDRLKMSQAAAYRLLELLNHVLDMARIESDKVVLNESAFDLAALLQGVVAGIGSRAKAKGLSVQLDGAAALPPFLMGDALRINQALIHLADNAVKFTERGGVTLAVEIRSRDATGIRVAFSVTDTGIGVAADDLERIFLAFEQADNSTTRAYGGAGLGLAISKALIALMGGKIEVSSSPGQGSTFAFTLNLKVAATKERTSDEPCDGHTAAHPTWSETKIRQKSYMKLRLQGAYSPCEQLTCKH